jgi:hypothetical protein
MRLSADWTQFSGVYSCRTLFDLPFLTLYLHPFSNTPFLLLGRSSGNYLQVILYWICSHYQISFSHLLNTTLSHILSFHVTDMQHQLILSPYWLIKVFIFIVFYLANCRVLCLLDRFLPFLSIYISFIKQSMSYFPNATQFTRPCQELIRFREPLIIFLLIRIRTYWRNEDLPWNIMW